jgi:hypothetical protein
MSILTWSHAKYTKMPPTTGVSLHLRHKNHLNYFYFIETVKVEGVLYALSHPDLGKPYLSWPRSYITLLF